MHISTFLFVNPLYIAIGYFHTNNPLSRFSKRQGKNGVYFSHNTQMYDIDLYMLTQAKSLQLNGFVLEPNRTNKTFVYQVKQNLK